MANKPNDDLFESSAMTFGEHLEELRKTLFKVLIWLAIGLGVGLIFADKVIMVIALPVEKAMEDYHQKKKLKDLIEHHEDPSNNLGELTEEDIANYEAEAEKNKWMTEIIYIRPSELNRVLGNEVPKELTEEDEPVELIVYRPVGASLKSLKAEEVFIIWFKAGLVFGATLVSPMLFWHFWQFIGAGLYTHEKKYVWIFLPFSLFLFFGGAALAYFQVFAPVLNFLFSFNLMVGIEPDLRISEWIGFVLFLPLGFGISFQLPLVMYFLNRMGMISVKSYISQWRIAILVIFLLSMVLTPADPISMLLLAIPLTVLYFGGILMCLWMPTGGSPIEAPAT
ncbi:MAG: twin-arginine translocase subunit TatC [Blastopirellula sp.]|nr:MAG: twin-arginine translocase subunit TatC [Blastopirellula sp.]